MKLKLEVTHKKSAVGRAWERQFFGFGFSKTLRVHVSEKSLKLFNMWIRELTRRTRGRNMRKIIEELRRDLLGWKA